MVSSTKKGCLRLVLGETTTATVGKGGSTSDLLFKVRKNWRLVPITALKQQKIGGLADEGIVGYSTHTSCSDQEEGLYVTMHHSAVSIF